MIPSPKFVVVDIVDAYQQFIHALSDPTLPTIDPDAALSQVVDALKYKESATDDLQHVKQNMIEGDYLVDRAIAEDMSNVHYFGEEAAELRDSLENVAVSATRLGNVLHVQLKHHGLYSNNVCDYEYQGVINDGTIILRRCA